MTEDEYNYLRRVRAIRELITTRNGTVIHRKCLSAGHLKLAWASRSTGKAGWCLSAAGKIALEAEDALRGKEPK